MAHLKFKDLYSAEKYISRAFEYEADRPNAITFTNNMRTLVLWQQEECPHCKTMMLVPNWPIEMTPMFPMDFLIREIRKYTNAPLTMNVDPEKLAEMYPDETGNGEHCGCQNH